MIEENKNFELADEDIEKVSGGLGTKFGDFDVEEILGRINKRDSLLSIKSAQAVFLDENGSGKNTTLINEFFAECDRKNLNIPEDFKAWLNSK